MFRAIVQEFETILWGENIEAEYATAKEWYKANRRELKKYRGEWFVCAGLDWREQLVTDASLYRPTEIAVEKDNLGKSKEKLAWETKYRMHDVVRIMVETRRGNVAGIFWYETCYFWE